LKVVLYKIFFKAYAVIYIIDCNIYYVHRNYNIYLPIKIRDMANLDITYKNIGNQKINFG